MIKRLILLTDDFNTTSRYLDDILYIDNVYFDNTVSQKYPPELNLNKVNTFKTETAFLNLPLPISNGIVSTKTHIKPDDFDFEIVNFPFLDSDAPRLLILLKEPSIEKALLSLHVTTEMRFSLQNCTPHIADLFLFLL